MFPLGIRTNDHEVRSGRGRESAVHHRVANLHGRNCTRCLFNQEHKAIFNKRRQLITTHGAVLCPEAADRSVVSEYLQSARSTPDRHDVA